MREEAPEPSRSVGPIPPVTSFWMNVAMRISDRLGICLLSLVAAALPPAALAQESDCGNPMINGTGPWDYRKPPKKYLSMVESRHYTANVRSLRRGTSTSDVGSDIAYTLRVFPNHHPALLTMAEWSLKSRANPPANVQYTVECWFERGIRFQPDDGMVKVVYGVYLMKAKKAKEAVKQLEAAVAQGNAGANAHYNLGLAYLEAGQFDKSLDSAHRAYAAGFPLPGLRDRLSRAGKWRDPVAAGASASAPAEAAPDDAAVAAVPAPAQESSGTRAVDAVGEVPLR